MFQDRIFKPKYFLGWPGSSLPLSILVSSSNGWGIVDTLIYAFCLCLIGLFFLGLQHAVCSFKKQTPVNWEIVWWCFPTCSILSFLWGLIRRS